MQLTLRDGVPHTQIVRQLHYYCAVHRRVGHHLFCVGWRRDSEIGIVGLTEGAQVLALYVALVRRQVARGVKGSKLLGTR